MNKYYPYIIAILAGLAVFYMWDWVIDNILVLFGLGAGGAVLLKKADTAKTIAKEHEDLSIKVAKEAIKEMDKADELHKSSEQLAKGIKPSDKPPKTGTTRKRFTAR